MLRILPAMPKRPASAECSKNYAYTHAMIRHGYGCYDNDNGYDMGFSRTEDMIMDMIMGSVGDGNERRVLT